MFDIKIFFAYRSGGKVGGAGMMIARVIARVLYKFYFLVYLSKEWLWYYIWGWYVEVDFKVIFFCVEEVIVKARGIDIGVFK